MNLKEFGSESSSRYAQQTLRKQQNGFIDSVTLSERTGYARGMAAALYLFDLLGRESPQFLSLGHDDQVEWFQRAIEQQLDSYINEGEGHEKFLQLVAVEGQYERIVIEKLDEYTDDEQNKICEEYLKKNWGDSSFKTAKQVRKMFSRSEIGSDEETIKGMVDNGILGFDDEVLDDGKDIKLYYLNDKDGE